MLPPKPFTQRSSSSEQNQPTSAIYCSPTSISYPQANVPEDEHEAKAPKMATWYDLPIEIQDEILEYLFVDVSVIFKKNLYQVEEENEIAANTNKRRISDVEPLPDCLSMLLVSKNFVNKRQAAEALLKQAVIGVTSMGDVEGLKSLFSSQQLAFVWKIAIQPPLASGSALSIADSSFQYMLSRGSTSTSVISVLDRVSVAFPNLQVIDYNVSPLRATPDLLNGESAINVALRKVSFNENMQLYYRTKCKKHGKKKLRRFKHPLCIWGADFDRELDFWLRIFAGHVVNNTLVYCTGRDSSSLTPEPRAIFADCALARGIYVNLSVEIQFESVICACFFNLTVCMI